MWHIPISWKYFSFLIWKLKNLVSLNSTHSRLADPRSNSLEGARRGIVMGQGGGEERRKINDGARERLNVRPTSINMASRPRRSPRLARFCTRPAKISARQYRTMPDCRHYGGHCRGLDMSPVASGIQAAISWPPLHPPLLFSRYRGSVCSEKSGLVSDQGTRVLLLNYQLPSMSLNIY